MWTVFQTVPFRIALMRTQSRFVITEMVPFLRIIGVSMKQGAASSGTFSRVYSETRTCVDSLIAIGTNASLLIVIVAVEIRIVGNRSIFATEGTATPLVLKMPVKALKWTMPREDDDHLRCFDEKHLSLMSYCVHLCCRNSWHCSTRKSRR